MAWPISVRHSVRVTWQTWGSKASPATLMTRPSQTKQNLRHLDAVRIGLHHHDREPQGTFMLDAFGLGQRFDSAQHIRQLLRFARWLPGSKGCRTEYFAISLAIQSDPSGRKPSTSFWLWAIG
ncbi:hypothetical protein J3458_000519 [Metarhizium acridum]|uniref:uncharacterized protein n=1 Tax=Metarhizium acridum TaxID=92637 RepID=UPI001C6B5C8B|nr:hypothetical protein J3458_000519 [Metarhizium acridum]